MASREVKETGTSPRQEWPSQEVSLAVDELTDHVLRLHEDLRQLTIRLSVGSGYTDVVMERGDQLKLFEAKQTLLTNYFARFLEEQSDENRRRREILRSSQSAPKSRLTQVIKVLLGRSRSTEDELSTYDLISLLAAAAASGEDARAREELIQHLEASSREREVERAKVRQAQERLQELGREGVASTAG
jgi:hypothetical protein